MAPRTRERMNMDPKDYPNLFVLGFCFSTDNQSVVLIQKKRPEWMSGLLNGVGGHVQHSESPLATMQREFFEETGLDVGGWSQRFIFRGRIGNVFVFQAQSTSVMDVSTQTDERVDVYDLRGLHLLPTLPNLQWMIPMILDEHLEENLGSIRERQPERVQH